VTKRPARSSKQRKRGYTERRLGARDRRSAGVSKPLTNRRKASEAKREFDAAHADGQRSFKAGDLTGLAKAVPKA
jgi:hypothetical protein